MGYKELIQKSKELADKIITNDEWIDIETIQHNAYKVTIYSYRTNKEITLNRNETEESINEKLKTISSQC